MQQLQLKDGLQYDADDIIGHLGKGSERKKT